MKRLTIVFVLLALALVARADLVSYEFTGYFDSAGYDGNQREQLTTLSHGSPITGSITYDTTGLPSQDGAPTYYTLTALKFQIGDISFVTDGGGYAVNSEFRAFSTHTTGGGDPNEFVAPGDVFLSVDSLDHPSGGMLYLEGYIDNLTTFDMNNFGAEGVLTSFKIPDASDTLALFTLGLSCILAVRRMMPYRAT